MNIATLCPTSQRSSMCDCQRRDVRMQRRNIPKRMVFPHRDVESNVVRYPIGIFFQHCDIPETIKQEF